MKTYAVCPICGKYDFVEERVTCPYCGWIHDVQAEEDAFFVHAPNPLSMEDFRLRYQCFVERDSDYQYMKNGFPDIPQIKPMECPVCHAYKFPLLTWDEILCGDQPSDSYCPRCGWHYDEKQLESPNSGNGANKLSLVEYREMYEKKRQQNPEYDYFEDMTEHYVPVPHKCPICGKYEFEDKSSFDICPWCGWEDDGIEDEGSQGVNELPFREYKARYEYFISQNPQYKWERENQT